MWPRTAPAASALAGGVARAALAAFAALAALAPPARADLPEHPAISRGPVPAWVAPAGEPRPAPAGATAVAYRLVDDQVLADGSRSAVFFQRVLEVVSQAGLEEAAQWEALFDPGSQRLAVHALEVFRDGAWSDRLASSHASVLQREPELSRRVYDESLTLLLVVEDVRVGDLVRIAYTVDGFNPVLGDRYAGGFALGWTVPVAEHRLRVLAPAARPVYFRLHGGAAPPPERAAAGGRTALAWHRFDVPAVEPEPDLPPGWIGFPFVQLSQFADWAEVAEWGRALYAPQPPPDEVTEVAIEIARAHPGDSGAQTVAAARWVQDRVRYFAIALGPHSHAPHDLAAVARRRYGDCKDKARLLVGLLAALGIEAWPALVDADWGDDLGAFHPSPFAFDHVVVVARPDGPRGRTVWIDPTLELQGGGIDDLWFPAYGHALELRPGVAALTPVPAAQTRPGVTAVRYDYRLSEDDGPFEVDIETAYERAGAERLRRTLAGTSAEELLDQYVEFYTDGERTVEPRSPLAIADDREANRLVVTERYRVVGCWQRLEAELNCDLLPLTVGSELVEPATAERSHPLRLPRDLHTRETVSIEAASEWEFAPVEETERNPWFEFTVSSTPGARSIELVYELKTRARMVEPGSLKRYARALRAMNDSTGYSLQREQPLERPPGSAGTPEKDPLEPLYMAIGCAVMAIVPLAFVAAVVLVIVELSRQRRRRSTAPAAATAARAPAAAPGSPAACPRCGAVIPPGARYCTACGAGLARPAAATARAGGGAGVAFGVVAAVAAVFLAIAFTGIIAAILIPNFLDALNKARQKRTVEESLAISAALEAYYAAERSYPEAATAADLAATLVAAGAAEPGIATVDGWERPFRYACWRNGPLASGCDEYRLVSAGADGEFEHQDPADYPGDPTDRYDFDRDLVFGPGGLVQGAGGPY